MKITVDTNLLVRVITVDDERQARLAKQEIRRASLVAVTLPTLCELVWVLKTGYGFSNRQIGDAIQIVAEMENVQLDVSAVEAGLHVLDEGGDFADGVIAHAGEWQGGEAFVSFDRKAVAILREQGYRTKLLRADPSTSALS